MLTGYHFTVWELSTDQEIWRSILKQLYAQSAWSLPCRFKMFTDVHCGFTHKKPQTPRWEEWKEGWAVWRDGDNRIKTFVRDAWADKSDTAMKSSHWTKAEKQVSGKSGKGPEGQGWAEDLSKIVLWGKKWLRAYIAFFKKKKYIVSP